ncbi:hypothetical protein HMPREF1544_12328 [Mucor circinelloides 1006PhL]|uniref:Uncharacterized protein n=1 Tax=Mucor circinelloides f. circinelloides (strain 1006PhL) TaxID=1220926 RepID=S2IYP8_MUCC1|nr:hypothetical protein HMPREF1544_12328 [Mucor circinelloides 1006PhL]
MFLYPPMHSIYTIYRIPTSLHFQLSILLLPLSLHGESPTTPVLNSKLTL